MTQSLFLVLPLITFILYGFAPVLIDIREHRLPNKLTFRLTVILLSVLVLSSLATGDWSAWLPMCVSVSYICGGYLFLFVMSKNGLGFGDVKFAIPCAATIGWYAPTDWLLYLWISFGLGAATAIILIGRGKASRASAIAFGPFMYLAVILVAANAVLSG
jgi:leader peptidase (prepilin peptidase)/N-methyltransferase